MDLPLLREQVKKKLPKMLREDDTLSIIWFSGRGQCGVLLEAEPVATLKDLSDMNHVVDRWLRPVGMTGFKEPLELVRSLTDRLVKGRRGHAARHLFFLSDGCDNQWPRGEVLEAVEKASRVAHTCTVVEYGAYADRALLTEMAEKGKGVFLVAEDWDKFEPQFSRAMQREMPKKFVGLSGLGEPVGGFVFALLPSLANPFLEGELLTYRVEKGTTHVGDEVRTLYALSTKPMGEPEAPSYRGLSHAGEKWYGPLYAALSLYAARMKPDVMLPLLKQTGDIAFIDQFAGCFGKQKYGAFVNDAKAAAFNKRLQLVSGFDPDRVPKEDAFTVLDVLELLQNDEHALVLVDDSRFVYKRIGRERLDTEAVLSPEDQAEVARLTEAMKSTKDGKKVKLLADKIAELSKKDALVFVRDKSEKYSERWPGGWPIDGVVWNESRPNLSLRFKFSGAVDLTSRLRKASDADPAMFQRSLTRISPVYPTHQYRNYTVIKDGFVHVERLPVFVSMPTFEKLKAEGLASDECPGNSLGREVVLDLKKLPVLNRKMVKTLSAKALFEAKWELTKLQAAQKVYNDYAGRLFGKPKTGARGITAEALAWLAEQGLTKNGYAPPHTTQAEATDEYLSKVLKVSIKSYSSLPSVGETLDRMRGGGKLTPSMLLLKEPIERVEAFLASNKPEAFGAWLLPLQKDATRQTRLAIFAVAQATFTTVVGQTWFREFSSLDDNQMKLHVDGTELQCKVEMVEEVVKV